MANRTRFTHRDCFLLRAKRGGGGPRSGGGGGRLLDADKHNLDRFVVQNISRRRSQSAAGIASRSIIWDSIRPLLVRMIPSRTSSNRSWVAAPSTAPRFPSPRFARRRNRCVNVVVLNLRHEDR